MSGWLVSRFYRQDLGLTWLVVALVVLSHFLLDGMAHVAGLPLVGDNSFRFGLGLWHPMRIELAIETLLAIVGISIYWRLRGATLLSRMGVAALVALATAATLTQIRMIAPPLPRQLIVSWLLMPPVFGIVVYFLDRGRSRHAIASTVSPNL